MADSIVNYIRGRLTGNYDAVRPAINDQLQKGVGTEQQRMLAQQVADIPMTAGEASKVARRLRPDYPEGLAYSSVIGNIAQGKQRLGDEDVGQDIRWSRTDTVPVALGERVTSDKVKEYVRLRDLYDNQMAEGLAQQAAEKDYWEQRADRIRGVMTDFADRY